MDILKLLERQRSDNTAFQQDKLLDDAYLLINGTSWRHDGVDDRLHVGSEVLHAKVLDETNIFDIDDIKEVCISNRLRFLHKKYYQASLPYDIHIKCAAFEIEADKPIVFKILTEAANFKANYPKNTQHLIFAELENGTYYFIKQWGNAYPAYRKLWVMPYKSFEWLFLFILVTSLLLTLITPIALLTTRPDSDYLSMIRMAYFFWCIIFLSALFTYYVFGIRKGLNTHEWDNESFI